MQYIIGATRCHFLKSHDLTSLMCPEPATVNTGAEADEEELVNLVKLWCRSNVTALVRVEQNILL